VNIIIKQVLSSWHVRWTLAAPDITGLLLLPGMTPNLEQILHVYSQEKLDSNIKPEIILKS
jgi:hypothetical protein